MFGIQILEQFLDTTECLRGQKNVLFGWCWSYVPGGSRRAYAVHIPTLFIYHTTLYRVDSSIAIDLFSLAKKGKN